MSVTPFVAASLALQVLLLGPAFVTPSIRPEAIQKTIAFALAAAALVATQLRVSLSPAVSRTGPLVVGIGLLAFALVSPLLGLVESRRGERGQLVYSTGRVPGTTNRFPGHLLTNMLGALSTAALVWVVSSTEGLDEYVASLAGDAAAFNIMLPLSTFVVFAFVRWQQVNACPDIDQLAKQEGKDWRDAIIGFSLRHWHQLTNVLYLIAATFIATTAVLYLFAYAMDRAKDGQPLIISWQAITAIVLALGFLLACGSKWSREHRAVYMTFLTGTPVALGASLLWLSWFQSDTTRNITAVSIVGIGYVIYCIEAVSGSRASGEKNHLHYYSAAGIAIILIVLLGALYVS